MKCKVCGSFAIYDQKIKEIVCQSCSFIHTKEDYMEWKSEYKKRSDNISKHNYKVYRVGDSKVWCTEMNEYDAKHRCFIETLAYDDPNYKFYYIKI